LLLDAFWSRTVTIVVSTYDGVRARRGQRSVSGLSVGRGQRHLGEGGRLENTPDERLKERRAAAGLGTGSSWGWVVASGLWGAPEPCASSGRGWPGTVHKGGRRGRPEEGGDDR
jgi:hypothetical protein